MIKVTGVRFRQAGKVYYFDPKNLKLERGSHVIVETARGHGVKGDAHVAVKLHLVIGAQLVRGPHEGKPCADEQAKRARVGAVVHARGVGIGVEQQRHLKR